MPAMTTTIEASAQKKDMIRLLNRCVDVTEIRVSSNKYINRLRNCVKNDSKKKLKLMNGNF